MKTTNEYFLDQLVLDLEHGVAKPLDLEQVLGRVYLKHHLVALERTLGTQQGVNTVQEPKKSITGPAARYAQAKRLVIQYPMERIEGALLKLESRMEFSEMTFRRLESELPGQLSCSHFRARSPLVALHEGENTDEWYRHNILTCPPIHPPSVFV